MGASFKIRHGKHAGVRIWRVREFEDYLIVYRPSRGGVRIERLIHDLSDQGHEPGIEAVICPITIMNPESMP